MRIWPAIPIVLAAWAAPLVGLALAGDEVQQVHQHDYRDGVISALQVQRNQSLDAVASLNATLVLKQDEEASLTEQLKNSSERVKQLEEELRAKVTCGASNPKDH